MTIDPKGPLAVAVVEAIRTGDLAGLGRLLDTHPGLATARIGSDGPDGATRSLLHVATDWPGHVPGGPATVALLVSGGGRPTAGRDAALGGPVGDGQRRARLRHGPVDRPRLGARLAVLVEAGPPEPLSSSTPPTCSASALPCAAGSAGCTTWPPDRACWAGVISRTSQSSSTQGPATGATGRRPEHARDVAEGEETF